MSLFRFGRSKILPQWPTRASSVFSQPFVVDAKFLAPPHVRNMLVPKPFAPWGCNLRCYSVVKKSGAKDPIGTLALLWKKFIWREEPFFLNQRRILIGSAIGLLALSKVLNVQVPLIFKKIIDSTVVAPDASSMLGAPFFLLLGWTAARLASVLSGELRNVCFSKVTQGVIRDINRYAFESLTSPVLERQGDTGRPVAHVIKILDRGARALQGLTSSLFLNITPTILECLVVIGMLWSYFGWHVAAISITGVTLYSTLTMVISEWRLSVRAQMNAAETAVSASLLESILNSEAIHTTPKARVVENCRHERLLENFEKSSLKTASSLAILNGVQGVLITSSMAAMLWLGLVGAVTTPGDLVLMHGLLFQLANPLGFLGVAYREGRQSLADVESLLQMLSRKDSTTSHKAIMVYDDAVKQQAKGSIGLDLQGPSIHHVGTCSLFPVGKRRILLVGASGGGKSTLARRLAMELGSRCIWIPQDVSQLFSRSIFANIAYGVEPEAKLTPLQNDKLKEIVQNAMLAANLPLEMMTREVGERGCSLSGGERQRVLIARAFARLFARNYLSSPLMDGQALPALEMVIMDEPTAWLDTLTEVRVLEALFDGLGNIPLVMVTHSIPTVANFSDWIVVVGSDMSKQPIILQEGHWKDLLAVPGPFADLWNVTPSNNELSC